MNAIKKRSNVLLSILFLFAIIISRTGIAQQKNDDGSQVDDCYITSFVIDGKFVCNSDYEIQDKYNSETIKFLSVERRLSAVKVFKMKKRIYQSTISAPPPFLYSLQNRKTQFDEL